MNGHAQKPLLTVVEIHLRETGQRHLRKMAQVVSRGLDVLDGRSSYCEETDMGFFIFAVIFLARNPAGAEGPRATAAVSISSKSPDSNVATGSNLVVGNGYKSLKRWDLSRYGAFGNEVDKATLCFRITRMIKPGNIDVKPVLSNWSDTEATWSNAPTLGPAQGSISMAGAGNSACADVTKLV